MVAVLVVRASLKTLAESLAPQLYAECSGEQFSVPLVSTAGGDVTHWASLPNVSEGVLLMLNQMVSAPPFAGNCWLSVCEPFEARQTFESVMESLGLREVES